MCHPAHSTSKLICVWQNRMLRGPVKHNTHTKRQHSDLNPINRQAFENTHQHTPAGEVNGRLMWVLGEHFGHHIIREAAVQQAVLSVISMDAQSGAFVKL